MYIACTGLDVNAEDVSVSSIVRMTTIQYVEVMAVPIATIVRWEEELAQKRFIFPLSSTENVTEHFQQEKVGFKLYPSTWVHSS